MNPIALRMAKTLWSAGYFSVDICVYNIIYQYTMYRYYVSFLVKSNWQLCCFRENIESVKIKVGCLSIIRYTCTYYDCVYRYVRLCSINHIALRKAKIVQCSTQFRIFPSSEQSRLWQDFLILRQTLGTKHTISHNLYLFLSHLQSTTSASDGVLIDSFVISKSGISVILI